MIDHLFPLVLGCVTDRQNRQYRISLHVRLQHKLPWSLTQAWCIQFNVALFFLKIYITDNLKNPPWFSRREASSETQGQLVGTIICCLLLLFSSFGAKVFMWTFRPKISGRSKMSHRGGEVAFSAGTCNREGSRSSPANCTGWIKKFLPVI